MAAPAAALLVWALSAALAAASPAPGSRAALAAATDGPPRPRGDPAPGGPGRGVWQAAVSGGFAGRLAEATLGADLRGGEAAGGEAEPQPASDAGAEDVGAGSTSTQTTTATGTTSTTTTTTSTTTTHTDAIGGGEITNATDNYLPCAGWFTYPGKGEAFHVRKCHPRKCPFMARLDNSTCHFTCVASSSCGGEGLDPNETIADQELMMCRPCSVPGCVQSAQQRECEWNETSRRDVCKLCMGGYRLHDGACISIWRTAWYVFYAVLAVLMAVLIAWYVSLRACRPVINETVLRRALNLRRRLKLKDPTTDGNEFYPLNANLLRLYKDGRPIGGPAVKLHFAYQYAILLWAAFAAAGWLAMALVVNPGVLSLGRESPSNIKDLCLVLDRERRVYDGTVWAKFVYTCILYGFTTLGSIAFAVRQRRDFRSMDTDVATMVDFGLVLYGFPEERGECTLEEERLLFVEQACGIRPVGVSICWDFHANSEEVEEMMANELMYWQKDFTSRSRSFESREPEEDILTGQFKRCHLSCVTHAASKGARFMDAFLLKLKGAELKDPPLMVDPDGDGANNEDKMAEFLRSMRATPFMYVVLNSREERDRVREVFSDFSSPPRYRDEHPIFAATGSGYTNGSPENVLWANFGMGSRMKMLRFAAAFALVLVVIFLWGVFFFAPYAWYVTTAYKDTRQAPGASSEMTFSMLVIIGNQLVYFVCEAMSAKIGFRFKGHEQAAYVILYTFAVITNLVFDMFVMLYVMRIAMDALGVVADDGTPLGSIPLGRVLGESYVLQSALGSKFFWYNFPSCFFLPFVCEALFVVVLPYHLGVRIVATRPVSQKNANECLAPSAMDFGRYVDVALNMIQSVIALCFVSGYVLYTFLGLIMGHTFVYVWDHYHVLRQMHACYFSSERADIYAQRLLVIPCGVLAGAMAVIAFEAFEVSERLHEGVPSLVIWAPVLAFLIHCTLHMFVMVLLVPVCSGREKRSDLGIEYEQAAVELPANWFNTNPIHALRSRYVHGHIPPCIYHTPGNEHLQKKNEAIGMHYEGNRWVYAWGRQKAATRTVSVVARSDLLALARQPQAVLGGMTRKGSGLDYRGNPPPGRASIMPTLPSLHLSSRHRTSTDSSSGDNHWQVANAASRAVVWLQSLMGSHPQGSPSGPDPGAASGVELGVMDPKSATRRHSMGSLPHHIAPAAVKSASSCLSVRYTATDTASASASSSARPLRPTQGGGQRRRNVSFFDQPQMPARSAGDGEGRRPSRDAGVKSGYLCKCARAPEDGQWERFWFVLNPHVLTWYGDGEGGRSMEPAGELMLTPWTAMALNQGQLRVQTFQDSILLRPVSATQGSPELSIWGAAITGCLSEARGGHGSNPQGRIVEEDIDADEEEDEEEAAAAPAREVRAQRSAPRPTARFAE